jgi:hypothetical protein
MSYDTGSNVRPSVAVSPLCRLYRRRDVLADPVLDTVYWPAYTQSITGTDAWYGPWRCGVIRHAALRGRRFGALLVRNLHLVVLGDRPVSRAYGILHRVRHSSLESGRVKTPCNNVDRSRRPCAI